MSSSDAGCDYNNDYQTAIYGKEQVSSIPVSVRYYQDSFISASEMTGGCSSGSSSSTSCFGMSRKEQNKLGFGMAGVGLFLFVVEIGLLVFMCMCCKDSIKSMFGRRDNRGLLAGDANAIPTAQPSYMPAQPATQPNYMPAQPNYMPTQPGYAPYYPQQQY